MEQTSQLALSADFLHGDSPLDDSFSPSMNFRGTEMNAKASGTDFHSPSLVQGEGKCHAYELKFLLSHALAEQVQAWAREHLLLDPHADPAKHDSYEIHTLYLDTAQFDMFHRREGYRNEKYRLRKYANTATYYLEHKHRKGDRVAKLRNTLALDHWSQFVLMNVSRDKTLCSNLHHEPWSAYRNTLIEKQLLPSCRMSYHRSAYMGHDEHGIVRLTLDRNIQGEVTNQWVIAPVEKGLNVLSDAVICELKFREIVPQRFAKLITEFKLEPASVSKYRRLLQAALGLLPGVDNHA
jgi:hypothetical protein